MKKELLFLLTLFCCISIYGAVQPGENLLLNGGFDGDETDVPVYWTEVQSPENIVATKNEGPGYRNSLKIFSIGVDKNRAATLRQEGLQLVPGEIYKLSVDIKTRDFASSNYGVVVVNASGSERVGLGGGSARANQDWTRHEIAFRMIGGSGDANGCAVEIYAADFMGEIHFANLKLEAVSRKALAGSAKSSAAVMKEAPRLIPWQPRLNWIPADQKEIEFYYCGDLPENEAGIAGKVEDYSIRCSVDGREPVVIPLQDKVNRLNLKDYDQGDHTLTLSIVAKGDGNAVYSEDFNISIVDIPSVEVKGHKRLNNLVAEVINAELDPTAGSQQFSFQTGRLGWIFIAAQEAHAENLEILLDGKAVIKADTDRLETFREIPAGEHSLVVKGAEKGGQLIVRTIPEIFNYCPGSNSFVSENKPFDWEFQKRYVLPAVTTQNGGNIPEEYRGWLRENGYYWLANLGSTQLKDETDLTRRMEEGRGFIAPHYDGTTCDEQFYGVPSLAYYTSGIKRYKNPSNRLIYTWIVGRPEKKPIHLDFISACVNASRGRGKLLCEKYMRTLPTREEAMDYLLKEVVGTIKATKDCYPNIMPSVGMIFGNFNQTPILTLIHNPAVDYKYYLDMQVNLLANNPEFQDLGCVGYWGSYYGDHELHRWSFMLMRHYFVEGKTTMLSDEYGLSYIPGHIENGDFEKTLAPWSATGNVESVTVHGFASASQNRWCGNFGAGDTMAAFTKNADEVSTVSQTARKLVPGKLYCLQFCTMDVNDAISKTHNPRRYGIECILGEGAEVQKELSWVHVDKRVDGRYENNNGVARCNLHHVVFKAAKPEVELTFTNAAALKGEVLGVNFVTLMPYIPEE